MRELTVPGTVPNLIRRGSCVIVRPDGGDTCYGAGVVLSVLSDGTALVAVKTHRPPSWWPLSDLDLDLTDPTSRVHAAWQASGNLAAHTGRLCHYGSKRVVAYWLDAVPYVDRLAGYGKLRNMGAVVVPALADLDPLDPRLFPDGSRLVDALALRAVVLHVAGVPECAT